MGKIEQENEKVKQILNGSAKAMSWIVILKIIWQLIGMLIEAIDSDNPKEV